MMYKTSGADVQGLHIISRITTRIYQIISVRLSTKMSVSFPAGGRNCGQVGGRNFFFFPFFFLGRKIWSIFFFFFFFFAKMKKKVPSRPSFFRHPTASPETDFFKKNWPE